MALSFVLTSTVGACELHLSKQGTSLIVNTASQCVSFDTKSTITFAGDTPESLTLASKKYNYPQEGTSCSDAIKFVNVKIWKVAVNKTYPDRPVKDILTWTTAKGIRASIGLVCGKELKPYNARYSWREILINNTTYAVVCE